MDSKNQVFSGKFSVFSAFPVLLSISFSSYLFRFSRWHFLLRRSGNNHPFFRGFFIYLSGFTFTATPGKVGELLRIKYLLPYGIPASRVLACFIYERTFDLMVVLLLSSMFTGRKDLFLIASCFVFAFLGLIIFLGLRPTVLTLISARMDLLNAPRVASLIKTLRDGLSGCKTWLNPWDALVSLLLGLVAWGLVALSFVYLLGHLGLSLPLFPALATYPLAMLAGAASMLPGGIGSTEVTLVALLVSQGATPGISTLAAVGIRLTTLWFAVICGLLAMCTLELWRPAIRNQILKPRQILENGGN